MDMQLVDVGVSWLPNFVMVRSQCALTREAPQGPKVSLKCGIRIDHGPSLFGRHPADFESANFDFQKEFLIFNFKGIRQKVMYGNRCFEAAIRVDWGGSAFGRKIEQLRRSIRSKLSS